MQYNQKAADVAAEVSKAVFGKPQTIRTIWMAMLAGGHVLIEDIPGVGKTTLALAFARALELNESRVQFTPDVLPSDITGFSLYNKRTGAMEYQPGAVLCNLFLADELNRATSRTQSALLEAMEEGGVTVDGVTHPVPQPFVVVATQNPAGASGTQLLPDSQLDRFMVKLSMGYPTEESEVELLRRRQGGAPLNDVRQVLGHDELRALRAQVAGLYMNTAVMQYIVRLVRATRRHAQVVQGASPRATLALAAMAKAAAFARGCDYVAPRDVQAVFPCTIAHRLLLAPEAKSAHAVCEEVLQGTKAPQLR